MKLAPLIRILVALVGLWVAVACRESKQPERVTKPKPTPTCAGGLSDDPPRSVMEPGMFAFEEKNYKEAQRHFSELKEAHPKSGTVLVWLGDAFFYDKDLDETRAAELGLGLYEAAEKLHGAGCALPRRARYYELIGIAYGRLRLARSPGPGRIAELDAADVALGTLEVEFPTSAEVPYTQARVACLRAAEVGAERDAIVERCYERFERTLHIASGYERPRFLRTFRSTQDWIVRSETQSEFGALRALPRYRELVAKATREAL